MDCCLRGFDWCETCDGDLHGRIWELTRGGLTLKVVANVTASDGRTESGWFPVTRDGDEADGDGAFLINTADPLRDFTAIHHLYLLAFSLTTEWHQRARKDLELS